MPGKVSSLGNAISLTMLDDQMVTLTAAPVDDNGNPISLPSGGVPTWATSPGTAGTVSAAADPTGLTAVFSGIKGQAGAETVTVSFTNTDGTVATGTANITTTIDPLEFDIGSFNVTAGTPGPQTASGPKSSKRP
jgi:hypothetical protein